MALRLQAIGRLVGPAGARRQARLRAVGLGRAGRRGRRTCHSILSGRHNGLALQGEFLRGLRTAGRQRPRLIRGLLVGPFGDNASVFRGPRARLGTHPLAFLGRLPWLAGSSGVKPGQYCKKHNRQWQTVAVHWLLPWSPKPIRCARRCPVDERPDCSTPRSRFIADTCAIGDSRACLRLFRIYSNVSAPNGRQ